MSTQDRNGSPSWNPVIPHLTMVLIGGQVLVYCALLTQPADTAPLLLEKLGFRPERVLAGEVWRLVTFPFVPPIQNPIFQYFFWYLFYLMGTVLESTWGEVRYNRYVLLGYLATVGVSLVHAVAGDASIPVSFGFIQSSVFLAFARLYPDFQIALMFLLPVRIRWLALLTWIVYGFHVITAVGAGDWRTALAVLAPIANYLVYFRDDILGDIRAGHRRMRWQAERAAAEVRGPRHRCAVCGATEESHPDAEFRYCSRCAGERAYCMAHLKDHDHVPAAGGSPDQGAAGG